MRQPVAHQCKDALDERHGTDSGDSGSGLLRMWFECAIAAAIIADPGHDAVEDGIGGER